MGLTDALLLILLVQLIFASKVLLDIRVRLPRHREGDDEYILGRYRQGVGR
jgi:hypothetical protein